MAHFDLFVIGAGSGGIACARRAASYGVKVGIAEGHRLGGTCVNVGCVPKKIMYNAAFVHDVLSTSKYFGFEISGGFSHNWSNLKTLRDNYINRLNNIYSNNLDNSKVVKYSSMAKFIDKNTIEVGDTRITADKIVIATGAGITKLNVPGEDLHGISNSDIFFEYPRMPKKVAVIGAGYIAVELAGVLGALGSETHLFVRGDTALRNFEENCKQTVHKSFSSIGVKVHPHSEILKFSEDTSNNDEREEIGINKNLLSVHLKNGLQESGFESVIVAIGRHPLIHDLNIDSVNLKVYGPKNAIKVDEYQNTNVSNIYALGDVCGHVELTPMAIACGRRLADRLFGSEVWQNAHVDFNNVPTVVFSHPTIGCIGLTEKEAIEKYGKENILVYNSSWVNLWYGQWPIAPADKPKSSVKMITLLPNEKVIGLHIVGMGADEMLQGFGVALKMGATKADFDNCVAIHPTAAEEIVTVPTWGQAANAHQLFEKKANY